jgi:hypothetical protein
MKFKLNDFVRVKSGVLLEETAELVPGWVGRITELPKKGEDLIYLIELDSISLQNLPEKYLLNCIEVEEPPFDYYFEENDLEISTRRDTKEQLLEMQVQIETAHFDFDDDDFFDTELNMDELEGWIEEFKQTKQFFTLSELEKASAQEIIEMYAENAFDFYDEQPKEWTKEAVIELFNNYFPGNIVAKIEYFAMIGSVMIQFFSFISEKKYQVNATELHIEALASANAIVNIAENPDNWGHAKKISMQGVSEGIDINDKEALLQYSLNNTRKNLESYLREFQNAKKQINFSKTNYPQSVRENPYKNLSRNEVIKVKYTDGQVKEGKFKRLEADLLAGKCTLSK